MVLKVFLVEDSAAMRAHLIDTLTSRAGVDVVGVAETESEAAGWLARHPSGWDIALIDLFLREGTGAGLIEMCRERAHGQSVLVMTNHARDAALLERCRALGADAVYHKAMELDSLVARCISLAEEKSDTAHS